MTAKRNGPIGRLWQHSSTLRVSLLTVARLRRPRAMTRAFRIVILLIAAFSACVEGPGEADSSLVTEPGSSPEPAVPTEAPALASAPAGKVVGTRSEPFVPYSCDALAPPAVAPVAAHPVTAALLAASPVGQLGQPLSAEVDVALADAALVSLEALSTRDRILIQAVALRAAKGDGKRAHTAAALARRVALDAGTLRALGSDPRRELEPWIGSAESWVERRGPSCGPLGAHDGAYGGELAFRTIRSGSLRVLFAQVVALDSELAPHVTPVIGLIELRTGMHADSPACVLEAGAERLDMLAFDSLHASPFIRVEKDGKVGCTGCHTGAGPYDLADLGREEGGAFRMERRLALLERARARVGELPLLRAR
jgi:hypothetical protein